MSVEISHSRYVPGTIVIRGSGYTYVSTRGRGQIAEHRLIMEQVLGRELEKGEKVVHLDNTLRGVDHRAFNHRENLAVVRCRTTKWVPIRSTVLWAPKKEIPRYKDFAKR